MRQNKWLKKGALISLLVVAGLFVLDRLFPPALPQNNEQHFARVVVDSSGVPLRAFADGNGVWRYQVKLQDVSPLYIEALLNYEDRWFWSHPGINPVAIARAAWLNLSHGRIVSGGSTITMQVARLLHPHKRTMFGKIGQLLRALQLEWRLSKTEILELYLNIAPFGGTIEGVQAASFTYLEKSAQELTHAEAALLAVLPQAPTRNRPDLNPKAAQRARDKVLDRMVSQNVWSQSVVDDAKLESVYAYRATQQLVAPVLAQRLIKQHKDRQVIKTTIDGDLQRSLEEYLRDYVEQLPAQISGAVLVVDNQTAQVKAYLGSADFSDDARFGHVDMVKASRSVGSTLKPFLFAMAIEQGLIHSHSLLMDVPRNRGDYRPGNFSGGFSGPVSASEALHRSLNVPFVDLLERFGAANFVDRLEGAGLKLDMAGGKANLSVILGGGDSSLERLVVAYSALANGGKTMALQYLADEQTSSIQKRHLLSQESSWATYQTLSDIKRPGSLNTHAQLRGDNKLAWKTGTSFGYRDNWAIGVSSQYIIGVWIGRPDGTPMPGLSARETAGPLLFAVSNHVHDSLTAPPKPDNVTQVDICWPLGIAPTTDTSFCHQRHKAWVIDETIVPTWPGNDGWHANPMTYWVNPKTSLRLNAHCNVAGKISRQIALWPHKLEPWLPWQYKRAGQLPKMDSACQNTQSGDRLPIRIAGVDADNIYRSSTAKQQYPSIVLRALGGSGKQHWYINGQLAHSNVGQEGVVHQFTSVGEKQLLVIDEAGEIDKVRVVVE